jgi:hypothetical protein
MAADDDLDALVQRSLKTLDSEAPSGYFDTLPDRISARLSGEAMQTSNRDASKPTTAAAPPLDVTKPREEDSGLHDIRNLAQSTKQRIKRTTGNLPHITQKDEDVLSSSSASWKNLALPQPAAMVSLPALQDLPNPAQAKREAKEQKAAAKAVAQAPVSVSAIEASSSMSGSVEYKPAFSSQARPAKSNRTRTIALIGMGVAAAAGITIFVATQNSSKSDSAQPTASSAPSNAAVIGEKAPATVVVQAPTVTPIPEPVDTAAAAGSAATGGATDESKVAVLAVPKSTTSKRAGNGGGKAKLAVDAPVADNKVAAPEKPVAKSGKAPEEGDPDFNQLLKEAGVKDKKAVVKLDKKELTSDDFKKGMAAITSKAQACYKGTQGSANVKLTIAPSGSVSKVTVSGAFAGKPEADCVAAAVKTASFPAWDGGPQSFGYPILLSE